MDQKTKHEHNDYSTLEVDESANLPQVKYDNVLPEVKPSHEPPQALPSHEDFPEVVRNGRKNATLCGLRRKAFWTTLLVAVLIIAIAIGVGVGVGVTRRSNSPSAKSSAGASGGANDGSNNGSSTNTSQPGYLASFSRLAAANYTDSQDRERALVYYQDNSLDMWKAERASSSTAWSRELVNMSGINPERGTPLTAFCLPETSVTLLHIYFIDAGTNRVRTILNEGARWLPTSAGDDTWTATNGSSLAMYANECKNDTSCGDKTAFLIFHSSMTNSTVQACPYGQCNFGYFLPDSVDVDDGQNGADPTAYALAPIQRIQNDTHPMVALYLSVQGKLKEFYFANGEAWNETGLDLPDFPMPTGCQLAAMSYVHDDLRYVQVFVTQQNGGVAMAYLDGGPDNPWNSTISVTGMENVIPLSPIAATRAGRVYALEQRENGVQIAEFNRTSVTGLPVFERLGIVDTPGG